MKLSFDDKESFIELAGCLCSSNNPSSDPNREQVGISSIQPQERNEEICFNNPSSVPNAFQQVGSCSSSSSMPPQE